MDFRFWPVEVLWCSTISVSILDASVHKQWITPAGQVIRSPQESGTALRLTETNPRPERQMTSMSKSAECSSIVARSANRRLAMTRRPLRNRTEIQHRQILSWEAAAIQFSARSRSHQRLCHMRRSAIGRVCRLCPKSARGRGVTGVAPRPSPSRARLHEMVSDAREYSTDSLLTVQRNGRSSAPIISS